MLNSFERRRDTVTLWQGADEAHLRDLAEEIENARKLEKSGSSLPRTMDEVSPLVAAEDAYREAKAEAEQRSVKVTVQALGRKQWRSLVKQHAPRPDNGADEMVGVNQDTFPDVLVPISIVEPAFDTPADRDAWLDDLSDAQYDELYFAAFKVNRGTFEAPKVPTGSPSSSVTGE